jgi:hypothetical protein
VNLLNRRCNFSGKGSIPLATLSSNCWEEDEDDGDPVTVQLPPPRPPTTTLPRTMVVVVVVGGGGTASISRLVAKLFDWGIPVGVVMGEPLLK